MIDHLSLILFKISGYVVGPFFKGKSISYSDSERKQTLNVFSQITIWDSASLKY